VAAREEKVTMKLLLAIVQQEDAGGLIDALTKREFRATRINTAGGFLKRGNATVLLGVDDHKVNDVLSVIQANCRSRVQSMNLVQPTMEPSLLLGPSSIEVDVGGATVFVLSAERHERL
jgi:uncharacterized protein YaaQ